MYRILRSIKNQGFGSIGRIRYLWNASGWLRYEQSFRTFAKSGSWRDERGSHCLRHWGIRLFLIERLQALVSSAVHGNPQRSATGFDLRRMNMLLAVLEKRVGFVGTERLCSWILPEDWKWMIRLSICRLSVILSSNMDAAIEPEVCVWRRNRSVGERDTSCESNWTAYRWSWKVRVSNVSLPKYNLQAIDTQKLKIELVPVRKVEEAFRALFG